MTKSVSDRPNIVIFNPDQFRADCLGHLGNPAAHTPNLDALIQKDAVSLRYAFCQNPVCTPSRCSFMSGWYPHVAGHRTMFHMMHKHEPVLLKLLKDNGYTVWWGGKNDLVPGQAEDPFGDYCTIKHDPGKPPRPIWAMDRQDQWRGKPGSDTYYSFYVGKLDKGDAEFYHDGEWSQVLGAVDFIKAEPEPPFCLYLPLTYPHPPYAVEDPWYSLIDRAAVPEPAPVPAGWEGKPSMLKGIYQRQGLKSWDRDRWIELIATYYGMCSRVDHQFGLVINALKAAGLYDTTAVFFFSDHGDFAGDYGLVEKNQNTFEDCLTRVPFVVKPPRRIPVKPRIVDGLAELVDFPATVQELTGIEFGYTHFGRSLVPLLKGQTDEHRDTVFCEGGRVHGEVHCMERESTSSQRPEGLYWPRVNLQSSEGPEHTKAVMGRTKNYKYVRRLYEEDELYDLRNDPRELHNVAGSASYQGILQKLKDRMLTFFLETGDVVPHKTDKR